MLPISTLAALAQGAYTDLGATRVLAALDARMSEVYWGIYQINNAGVMELHGAEQVCAPGEVVLPLGGEWLGAGSGWKEYGAALRERSGILVHAVMSERLPRARDSALLGMDALRHGLAVSAEQANLDGCLCSSSTGVSTERWHTERCSIHDCHTDR